MPEGQTVENNSAVVAEPVTGQSESASTGTLENQNGQAGVQEQGAPVEESFSTIDPKTLPPEMQAIYKNLQSDFTKKTQSIAETRKKAEAFEKLSSDQRFVDYWNNASKTQKAEFKAEAEKQVGRKLSEEEFQKAFESQDAYEAAHRKMIREELAESQKEIQALRQQVQVKEASDIVDNFATELDPKSGKPIRPDFYALDEDKLISGYLNVNPPSDRSAEAYTAKLNEAYSWAKAITQKSYEKGKAEALQIVQKKAASSTQVPTNGSKSAYTGADPRKLSVKEAYELAKQGIRVPRDD